MRFIWSVYSFSDFNGREQNISSSYKVSIILYMISIQISVILCFLKRQCEHDCSVNGLILLIDIMSVRESLHIAHLSQIRLSGVFAKLVSSRDINNYTLLTRSGTLLK